MDIQDCIRFARQNPHCYLATSVGNQPHVRCVGLWFADESGFYFQSATAKEFPEELRNNPNTEVCFYHHQGTIGTMLRVAGAIEFLDSTELRERVMRDRPFLRSIGIDETSDRLVFFRIPHGKAHFWTMAVNLEPKDYIPF